MKEILALLMFLLGRGGATVLVTDPGMTRMVALSGERCDYYTDRSDIRRAVLETSRRHVKEMAIEDVEAIMAACRSQGSYGRGGFIFPGTKWCGPGTVASNYHDLGPRSAEDRCCREHDHCPATLAPGECRAGLCNHSPFTRSHCDCDHRFKRCLQMLDSPAAHTLGAVFFNVAQVMCFRDQRPCYKRNERCGMELIGMEPYYENEAEPLSFSRAFSRFREGLFEYFGR